MALLDGVSPPAEATTYLVNHVALPPQLPRADDFDAEHERCLLSITLDALCTLKPFVTAEDDGTLSHAILTIKNLIRSQDRHGNVSEVELRKLLNDLASGQEIGSIPLEIKAQNAGILITSDGERVTFDFFELSPDNKSTMTKGRLIRTFPGLAASIPIAKLRDQSLQHMFADTLAKMSTQAAPGFQPQAYKAGRDHDEDRDTTHPGMVTDFLLHIVAALGETTNVARITKHTREEVLWSNCKTPWRRSPMWLLVRVSLQLICTRHNRSALPDEGLYKVFMIQLLSLIQRRAQDSWQSLGNGPLHVLNAKMLHRLRKLEPLSQLDSVNSSWLGTVKACMVEAYKLMDQKWNFEVHDVSSDLNTTHLKFSRPEASIDMHLPELDKFLVDINARKKFAAGSNFRPGPSYPTFHRSSLPKNFSTADDHRYFRLAAVETWVETHLQSWIASYLSDEATCGQLYDMMKEYHSSASAAYNGLPSSMSIMYLTILEIWVACDRSACKILPLLVKYEPEVRLGELQCLTLPRRNHMQRLNAVETYVQRRELSSSNSTSIFRDFGKASSFAVQYFNTSNHLQAVMQQIQQDAAAKRAAKCTELARMKSQHKDLMDRYNSTECKYVTIIYNRYHGYTRTVHDRSCNRCGLKKRADDLGIDIHEWPLPSNESTAKATVFELKIPHVYRLWRDASAFVISDVLGCKNNAAGKPQGQYILSGHHDLSQMLDSQYQSRRIVPLSEIKPHVVTHRKSKKAVQHLSEEDVCLKNGLRYQYYDTSTKTWTAPQTPSGDLSRKCTYQMPARSKTLERFLSKPPSAPDGIPPNEVIASLSDCPSHYSLEEYKASGALPLGRNIFYMNILTQLAIPTLDFSKVETQSLILQTVAQVGLPNDTVQRTNHSILTDATFGTTLIAYLELAAQRVAENWESWRALATFVQVASRITNLTTSSEVRTRCLHFLHEARQIALVWLHRLKTRAASSTNEEQRTELFARATEIALLGAATFDVDNEYVDVVLQQHDAISSFLHCSIAVQENKDLLLRSEGLENSTLQAWRSLAYRMFLKLRAAILCDSAGLNQAILRSWAAFAPAANAIWEVLDGPHQHWLHITSGSLPVHLNLLTGELLVNGLPLSRLPSEYQAHPMYKPLFSGAALEVVPTDEPGMRFSAKAIYNRHKLHFGMIEADMLVVGICEDKKYDLIPAHMFAHRMPLSFSSYVHWYDHESQEISFRPRNRPWEISGDDHWVLRRHGSTWRLHKGSQTLLDIKSDNARTLSSLFKAVEDEVHTHILYDPISQSIEIELPRLKLNFHVARGNEQVWSRQYRGMILDTNQRIGTLVGLTSKLVLRRDTHANERLVLIPAGLVSYRKTSTHHISVNIRKEQSMTVHAYQLDQTLGRVLDSGAMQSKLMLCFLHALTSYALPDPFTGYTGTESALNILGSSAVRSFQALSFENVALLNKIAGLSPTREFYPRHMRVMQQVGWNPNIPFQSQHGDFQVLVKEIFQQEKTMSLFHSNNVFAGLSSNEVAWMSAINTDLHDRAASRASTLHVEGFGTQHHDATADRAYNARDQQSDSTRARRAFLAASVLMRDKALLHQPIANFNLHQTHFQNRDVKGYVSTQQLPDLSYDSKWLSSPSPSIRELWCTLHHALATKPHVGSKFDVLIWLSTMAYATDADIDVLQALAACYRFPELASIKVPAKPVYRISQGSAFKRSEVQHAAESTAESYEDSSEAQFPKQNNETDDEHLRRIELLFQKEKDTAVQNFVASLEAQWPCESPCTPASKHMNKYLNMSSAMETSRQKYQIWFDNRDFERYIGEISGILKRLPAAIIALPRFSAKAPLERTPPVLSSRHCDSAAIFSANAPDVMSSASSASDSSPLFAPQEPKLKITPKPTLTDVTEASDRLDEFCQALSVCAKTPCEQSYVNTLRASCNSLHKCTEENDTESFLIDEHAQELLRNYLSECELYFKLFHSKLREVLETGSSQSNAIASAIHLAPRQPPSYWLSQLNRDRYEFLPRLWSNVIIEYGLAITNLHRAQRLVTLLGRTVELNEELQHVGHTNWDPREFPETLLLEAESGILVRKVQAIIAAEMMEPKDDQNTVMQLNMGEGKSSTIVPTVAAALADKKKLVRVIVAKPQSKQMLQMLVAKLGGLLNRRIYHMPFSRELKLSEGDAQAIREMYLDCMARRGVLLIQPEHILSFKLMGIECLLTDREHIGRSLMATEQWFQDISRDIVDESDENFSVKFELIYTMGSQRSIGFAPDRWLIIQEILGLLPRLASQVKSDLPLSVEVQHDNNGEFPRVRILRDDGAEVLLRLLSEHIVKFGLTGLPIRVLSKETRGAIMQYISAVNLDPEQITAVEKSRFWTEATREPLLLVRGLIAGGVIRFALTQKRWRVNYGLDPTRNPSTDLAVPYKAKDSPSPRSEFSHPDVVILLTLLSYYYGGLQDDELFNSFSHLLKSDQANIHYDEWVRTAAPDLPAAFRQLSGVSVKDRIMCIQQIFPHLRYSRSAINYYLTYLVFPKAMKEFPSKLSASGWDLGAIKTHATTGFSGTNDTLHVLPLAVKHLDLESQSHTNALVLGYLLQQETSVEKLPHRSKGTDAEHLLNVINNLQPEVRVVLDVGAQILEMKNTEVARCWLSMRKNDRTEAVVFFEDEELSVLNTSGRIESFQTSPFAKQLDRCLVYLDEAHTRGTDLKLPRDYRAAVTLGANLTKDRLVQACMGLRKLGKGQSVVFMATQEICTKVCERTAQSFDEPFTVANILCWSIGETWQDLSRSMPLWAVQGHRYETHKHLLHGSNTTVSQAEQFLEDEAQSIEDRYTPHDKNTSQSLLQDLSNPSIKAIHTRCVEFQAMGFNVASLQEEQERELSPEIEEERQVERPRKMAAESHKVHADVEHLVRTGDMIPGSSAFEPAFKALATTSAASHYDLSQFPDNLLVTKDFMKTVKIPPGSKRKAFVSDSYQRSVQWILSVVDQAYPHSLKRLIILSPFEANELRHDIEKYMEVTLHLFAPRFNVSFDPLDELKLFNIGRTFKYTLLSRSLVIQLNLFAGSLYLRSLVEYQEVCDVLGLLHGIAKPDQQVNADGFIDPPSGEWNLKTSPVQFLRALLMKIRKEGEGVEKTHMGRLLGGARLEETDFKTEAAQVQSGAGPRAPTAQVPR